MKLKTGFIGLGAMGGPMAQNLLKKGYELTVFDLAKDRMDALVKAGARAADSCREVAEQSDVIITMVPSSPHARNAILGPPPPPPPPNGVIEGVSQGSVVVDMSTIDPVTTREISEALANRGVQMLDAPVARGVSAAVAGTLAIFVGGNRETFDQCKDLLSAMGSDIDYVGASGAGEVVKIVNNLIIAVTMCALSEAMVLGVKAGVEPDVLFEALSKGSADSFVLRNHVRKFAMKGKFETGVFPVDYIMKDLNLALETATKYQIPQYFGSLAYQNYELARASGYADRYYPVVIRILEKLAGVEVRATPDDNT